MSPIATGCPHLSQININQYKNEVTDTISEISPIVFAVTKQVVAKQQKVGG